MLGSVRKRGSKWYYCFDLGFVNGKRKRIERVGGFTKKEAEAALRKALSELDTTGIHSKPTELSFADYLDQWNKDYVQVNLKHNTQLNYQKVIDNHLKPELGDYKLKYLQPKLLQNFINEKKKCGYSKSTVSLILTILSKCLNYAVQPCGYIKSNPTQYVDLPKIEEIKKESHVFTKNELKYIFETFKKGHDFYIPLMVALHAGTRLGETLGLLWDNIDLENKIIKIRYTLISENNKRKLTSPKTNTSYREIPLGNELYKVLKAHKKYQTENKLKYGQYYIHSKFVCTKENGTPLTSDDLRYFGMFCRKKLDIKANFHSLRHTHATVLLENGADIKEISCRLGHANLSTTMDVYSHVTKKMSDKSISILDKNLSL